MSESPEPEESSQDVDAPARVGDATKFRVFAASLDTPLALLVALLCGGRAPGLSDDSRPVVAVAAYLAYFLIQEGLWSTTVGKWLFGLRVCYPDGSRCGWTAASIRTALRVVEANPLLAGGLPAALAGGLSRRHQRLGDMLARCLVTRDGPATRGHAPVVRTQPALEPKQ